jgi:glyoxylase-like metal-dependent hydrolase (beta-lactamase superfamily II)
MQIISGVHVIPSVVVNVYLIVDDDGLTLVDVGLRGSEKRVLRYIAGLGHAPDTLKRIVITHSDGDHVGALAALEAATLVQAQGKPGARVYASAIEAEAIAAGRMSRPLKVGGLLKLLMSVTRPWFQADPAQVDECVTDGQVLPALGGLRVVDTPGHTPGHVSYFAPSACILFVGDSLVSTGGRLRSSRGMNTWDEARALESVRKQAALGARIVCPAHGPVVRDAQFPQV